MCIRDRWEADTGIGAAFADIEEAAERCRFRDCSHEDEPGCAVRAAVESGDISEQRYASYQACLLYTSSTVEVVDVEDIPMAYLGDALCIRVKAVGDLML